MIIPKIALISVSKKLEGTLLFRQSITYSNQPQGVSQLVQSKYKTQSNNANSSNSFLSRPNALFSRQKTVMIILHHVDYQPGIWQLIPANGLVGRSVFCQSCVIMLATR